MKQALFRGLLTILYTVVCFTTVAYAQDTLENKIRTSLTTYYQKSPQEKIFIHTDKSIYAAGQTIWYKVYATAYGRPSQLSKIVYIQLTDKTGNILAKNKLQISGGISHGNIDLPANLTSGWYQLTSFTAWMMNFGPQGFCHQKIYVRSLSDTSSTIQKSKTTVKYQVAFFPESGDLIEGALNNIAFKATDDNGMPVTVKGLIEDNTGKTIASLAALHDGMGVFTIEGYSGKNYYASVQFPDGSNQKVALPPFKKTGLAMQVNSLPANEVEIKIAFIGDRQKYRNVLMAAFQNNGLINTYPLQLNPGTNVFSIKKSEFSTGILRLTVFTSEGLPQAERIVFINNHDQLRLSLKADTLTFKPKSKSEFTFAVGSNGLPAAGNFSVSVTDADAINDIPDEDIYSSLLLTSELKGRIYRPAYYFTNSSDTLQKQLDLVMLTNGWRHFKWDEVLNNTSIAIKYPVEKSQFIAGRIIGYHPPADAKSESKIKLIITNEDSTKYIGYITPDSTGSFIMKDYNHTGASEVYFEVANAKNHKQKVEVKFMKGFIDTVNLERDTIGSFDNDAPVTDAQFLSDALNDEKVFNGNGILLNTIEIKNRKASPTDELIKQHVNRLVADKVFTLDIVNSNAYASTSIINLIRGRFPGLQVYGDDNSASFLYQGGNSLGYGGPTYGPSAIPVTGAFLPYFYLNEHPITFNDIQDIPIVDLVLIRFAPPPVWFAPYNGGNVGALLFYTKKPGDDIGTFKKEAFDKYTFNGYSITREFYSPDYGSKTTDLHHDTRSTLYWNYDLVTGSKGEIKFNFYNSDKTKKYRIIIQGMDAQGRLGYLNQVF
jgi:hypothetical protein